MIKHKIKTFLFLPLIATPIFCVSCNQNKLIQIELTKTSQGLVSKEYSIDPNASYVYTFNFDNKFSGTFETEDYWLNPVKIKSASISVGKITISLDQTLCTFTLPSSIQPEAKIELTIKYMSSVSQVKSLLINK